MQQYGRQQLYMVLSKQSPRRGLQEGDAIRLLCTHLTLNKVPIPA